MLWQVLVTHMDTIYSSCSYYCEFLGRECVGAWEEDDDTCQVLSTEDCNHRFGKDTSDAKGLQLEVGAQRAPKLPG